MFYVFLVPRGREQEGRCIVGNVSGRLVLTLTVYVGELFNSTSGVSLRSYKTNKNKNRICRYVYSLDIKKIDIITHQGEKENSLRVTPVLKIGPSKVRQRTVVKRLF